MKNFTQTKKLKKFQKKQSYSTFSNINSIDNWKIKVFSSLVLVQSNTVSLTISQSNGLVLNTSAYNDSENLSVKINTTSNDLSNKDLTINHGNLLSENKLLETDIF